MTYMLSLPGAFKKFPCNKKSNSTDKQNFMIYYSTYIPPLATRSA